MRSDARRRHLHPDQQYGWPDYGPQTPEEAWESYGYTDCRDCGDYYRGWHRCPNRPQERTAA